MAKDVMFEIRRSIPPGSPLVTPSGRSRFEVHNITEDKLLLKIGNIGTYLSIPISCFEDLPDFLKARGWVKIGAIHGESEEGTVDQFVKRYTYGISAASYVAPILEKSKIIEVHRERPAKVRLI